MLELDLIGRKVTLTDGDVRLLLTVAEAGSGSSISSRDLATRLKGLAAPSSQSQRRLVLSRPESRALQQMIRTQIDSYDRLHELRATLAEVLANGLTDGRQFTES